MKWHCENNHDNTLFPFLKFGDFPRNSKISNFQRFLEHPEEEMLDLENNPLKTGRKKSTNLTGKRTIKELPTDKGTNIAVKN